MMQVEHLSRPYAWKARDVFGVIVTTTPPQLLAMIQAFFNNALLIDDDFLVKKILSKLCVCALFFVTWKSMHVFITLYTCGTGGWSSGGSEGFLGTVLLKHGKKSKLLSVKLFTVFITWGKLCLFSPPGSYRDCRRASDSWRSVEHSRICHSRPLELRPRPPHTTGTGPQCLSITSRLVGWTCHILLSCCCKWFYTGWPCVKYGIRAVPNF